jgi:redox-sensitive bicupin YhaK (pirin superfamily)
LLQVWIVPQAERLEPTYAQQHFGDARLGRLCLLASPDGRDHSVQIRQDALLYAALLAGDEADTHQLAAGRGAWLQVARGSVTLNGERLDAGDGAAIEDEPELHIAAAGEGEVLLFDLG